jgi:SAM-dependent methyltransferase
VFRRSCLVPANHPARPAQLARGPLTPLWRHVSRQARQPYGPVGWLLSRIWIRESATVNDTAIALLAPTTGERILELGFGPGRTLGSVAATRATVVGVETSWSMLRTATRRNREHIRAGAMTLHHGDGRSLPIETRTVDGAISVHTIYFWPDPAQTLAELNRVLRPGGRLVLAFRAGEHRLPHRLDPDVYRSVPTTEQTTQWLGAAGFTDVRAETRPATAPAVVWLTATTPA